MSCCCDIKSYTPPAAVLRCLIIRRGIAAHRILQSFEERELTGSDLLLRDDKSGFEETTVKLATLTKFAGLGYN